MSYVTCSDLIYPDGCEQLVHHNGKYTPLPTTMLYVISVSKQQEGFASAVEKRHRWLARLYFMIFYIIQLVITEMQMYFILSFHRWSYK